MATGTHLQNWLKKELQIGFEEEEREEYENGRRRGVKTKQGFVGETEREEEREKERERKRERERDRERV